MDQVIISNLSKTYANGVKALNDISLKIPVGMYGLLGPNGAGKSTLMRTLVTLQEADSGSIRLGNLDLTKDKRKVREVIGYLPQEFGLYPQISAFVLLDHLASLKGISNKKIRRERVRYLLDQTNLYAHKNKRLGTFSGGMKQRFGIAQALLTDPKMLIVDEPTAGLDPSERNRFYNLLSNLSDQSIVILSTHIVEDVKELCTRMAIINKGELLLEGDPQKLIQQLNGNIYRKEIPKSEIPIYKQEYQVIADKYTHGRPYIFIYSENNPGNSFTSCEAELDHVYFSSIYDAA